MLELDEITKRTIIIDYLKRYKKIKRNKLNQEERIAVIEADFRDPLTGKGYDGMFVAGFHKGSQQEKLSEELEEVIEDYKLTQKARIYNMAKELLAVNNLINLIPADTDENEVLMLKYINDLGWKGIARKMNMSIRTAQRVNKQAIDMLMINPKTIRILEQYAREVNHNIE